MIRGADPSRTRKGVAVGEGPETTVLVAVESARVREGLVAMIGTLNGFRIVAETDNHETALKAARRYRPRLALIEPELSGCRGWWAIQQIRSEELAGVVVGLGRRANGSLAELAGAQSYVQIGISPRDLLCALEAAIAHRRPQVSGAGQTEERELLADSDAMLDKPAFVDF